MGLLSLSMMTTSVLVLLTSALSSSSSGAVGKEILDPMDNLEESAMSGERIYGTGFGFDDPMIPYTSGPYGGKRTPFNSWGGKRAIPDESLLRLYNFLNRRMNLVGGTGKRSNSDTRTTKSDQTTRREPLFSSWRGK